MHNIIDNEQKLTMLRNNLVFHAPKLIFWRYCFEPSSGYKSVSKTKRKLARSVSI